jgi:malate dehydrogenase (oxaloacetate-decarboxylating)
VLIFSISEAMRGADVFIGVSKPGILTQEMVKMMNANGIVFAMANPVPEILPDLAKLAGAAVVATGRSDFPNQVNNSLGFPGIFRGLLDGRIRKLTMDMKLSAACALADYIPEPTDESILPSPLDKNIAGVIARAICQS